MGLIGKAQKFARLLPEPQWRGAFARYRVAAGVEHVAVLGNVDAMRTVVDIGANRGQFALAARHCFPDAEIHSFEPLHGPAEVFDRVFAHDERVHLHRVAIGATAGTTSIHVSRRDDSSSLLPISDLQDRVFPGTNEVGTEAIEVAPLSRYLTINAIKPPALLKLDVQGYELQALKGCEDLLDRFAYVYAECSFMELYQGQALAHEVIAWLQVRGFRMAGCYHMAYDRDGKAVQADFLFEQAPTVSGTS